MDIMKPGDFRQALPLRRRHLFHGMSLIWLLLLPCLASGQNSGQEVETLNKQVEALTHQRKYSQAIQLAEKAAAWTKHAKGETSAEYAASVGVLAGLYEQTGSYKHAELLYKQTIEIDKIVFGARHPRYATDIDDLGLLYDEIGAYCEAAQLHKEALDIDKRVLGANHPDYAMRLNNLGVTYTELGRYGEAEPLYKQAIEIDRIALGEHDAEYATDLSNLGELYDDLGRYSEVEPLLTQALEIRKNTLGASHPDYASSLNNLAAFYAEKGRAIEAEVLYKQALEIRRKTLGESHPDYATSLNNLAELDEELGRNVEALSLYKRAIRIDRDALGTNNPDYASDLNNLAGLYIDTGHYDTAEQLIKQALLIRKNAFGDHHPDYASSLNDLAVLYDDEGRFSEAESLYKRAIDIRRTTVGVNHPDFATNVMNLAYLYVEMGRREQALSNFRLALSVEQTNLRQTFTFSSEHVMRSYLSMIGRNLGALLTLACGNAPIHPSATLPPSGGAKVALSWVLRRKGLVLDTMCRFQSSRLLTEANPAYASTSATYRLRRQQRANLALQLNQSPPTQQNALQHRLLDLDKEIDTLEGSLNRTLSDRQGDQTENEPTIEAVRARLPVGSALVEYVWFTPVNFGSRSLPQSGSTVKTGSKAKLPVPAGKPSPATSRAAMLAPLSAKASRYIAFVLSSVPGIPVRLIDLGDASSVDTAVLAMRRSLEQNDPLGGEKRAYGQFTDASHTLYKRIFAPLESALGSTSRLLIAPDGELNRVPFDALLDGQNRYVLKTRQLSYLTCGRDLLRPTYTVGQGAVVFAAPNFDLGVLQRQARARQLLPGLVRTSTLSPAAGGVFAPLPRDARTDGSVIGATLQQGGFGKVQVYVGDDALEEVFKAVSAPLILHVLTHGFYQPDVQRSQREEHLAVARVQGLANPLLRCGIVLAGANARPKATDASADVDDGWVTAEEMGQMNLRGTELVVLSSCESGLGDIQAGEGVFGVRRALMYAGAHSLVTSLFEVPTQPTRTIMKSFYSELAHRQSRQEALHNAQVQQLNADTARGAMIRPRSWAGFILIGEPGKMPIVNKDSGATPAIR